MSATVSNDDPVVSIERPALYVVATPIGNLADVTLRAIAVLSNVDTILAEDTRISAKLLRHYGIETSMRAIHEHNERELAAATVDQIRALKQAAALISDAGTPLVSDPGFHLVNAALDAGIAVISVPGACAAVTALAGSGMATDQFVFIGFLAAKRGPRERALAALKTEKRTMIFYEAPHRIQDTLGAMQAQFGEQREIAIARELTKRHETLYRGTVTELLAMAEADTNFTRGELVIICAGAETSVSPELEEAGRVLALLTQTLPPSEAIRLTGQITGVAKNILYRLAHFGGPD